VAPSCPLRDELTRPYDAVIKPFPAGRLVAPLDSQRHLVARACRSARAIDGRAFHHVLSNARQRAGSKHVTRSTSRCAVTIEQGVAVLALQRSETQRSGTVTRVCPSTGEREVRRSAQDPAATSRARTSRSLNELPLTLVRGGTPAIRNCASDSVYSLPTFSSGRPSDSSIFNRASVARCFDGI
jgi:hypothetical protein